MAYGARQWGTKSFADGLGAPDLAVPAVPLVHLYGPGALGSSSIGVNTYGGPAGVPPGVIPPVEYFVSIDGLLPITGALGPKSQLALSGSMELDSEFVLEVTKAPFTGTLTSAGTLTMRASDIRINGQVTPTGVVSKLIARSLSSTLTPAGALHNLVTLVAFSGQLDINGTYEPHRQSLLPTMTAAISATGSFLRRTLKGYEASLFPQGSLSLGIQSPGGYAGTVTPMGSLTLTYPNGLTALAQVNMSGRVSFQVERSLTGTMTSSSTLQRVSSRSLASTITPSSVLARSAQRSTTVSGSLTPAASFRPTPQKRLTASISSTGTVATSMTISLSGSIASAGSRTLQGSNFLTVESVLTPTGRLTNEVTKNLAGTITPWSTTVAIYYEPMVLVPGFVYTKWRRGVLLP